MSVADEDLTLPKSVDLICESSIESGHARFSTNFGKCYSYPSHLTGSIGVGNSDYQRINWGSRIFRYRSFFTHYLDNRRRKQRRKDDLLFQHSQLLVNHVFKKWFERRDPSLMLVASKYVLSTGGLIYRGFATETFPAVDPVWLDYFDQAMFHLKSGYPQMFSLWKNIQKRTSEHLEVVKSTLFLIQKAIHEKVATAFPSLSMMVGGKGEAFDLIRATWEIFSRVQEDISDPSADFEPTYLLMDANEFLKNASPQSLDQITEILNSILNDNEIRKKVDYCLMNKEPLELAVNEFKGRLKDRIEEVEQVHLKLIGRCYRCFQIECAPMNA